MKIKMGNYGFVSMVLTFLYQPLLQSYGRIITLGILVPYNGSRSMGEEAEVAVQLAISKVNTSPELEKLRNENITIDYIIADTQCDIGTGLYKLVELSDIVHAFIGPACDELCSPAGLLAAKLNKPVLSYSCASSVLDSRTKYPTVARTSVDYAGIGNFVYDILHHFHWTRVILVQGHEDIWRETVQHYQETLEDNGIQSEFMSLPPNDSSDSIAKYLRMAADKARVFVICAYGRDVLHIMCAAENAGLLNGHYVFISIDFAYMTKSNQENRPCSLIKDLEGLLDITIAVSAEYESYHEFVSYLINNLGTHHGIEIGIHSAMLYDAVYLYALGLNAVFWQGLDERNGTQIISELVNHTFHGITGDVSINEYGYRESNFSLHNIKLGIYFDVAVNNGRCDPFRTHCSGYRIVHTWVTEDDQKEESISIQRVIIGGTYFYDNVDILWPGGMSVAPLGRPACGWDNEYCDESDPVVMTLVPVTIIFVLLISAVSGAAFYLYRKKKFSEKMESLSWKIPYDSLEFKSHSKTSSFSSRLTFSSAKYSKSQETLTRRNSYDSALSYGCQMFTKVVLFQGQSLAMKQINKQYIAITHDVIKEINEIRNLSDRNVNPLVGACTDPTKICILSLYCSRGSLQDVLENDNIKLDRIFKVSFASDIAKGMEYIHGSSVETHGRLKSSNVFIDAQWTCKVGDIAMPVFRDGEKSGSDTEPRVHYQLLWTAPELLRDQDPPHKGTHKGDIYAYAIILQEIVLRTGPYGEIQLEPVEIIQKVKDKQIPRFRPQVPNGCEDPVLDDVMRMCWEEVPQIRPTFTTVLKTLRKANHGQTTNLVDQMAHMMSKYADHLEELVAERTEQLQAEQKRTEELLCRMIPRSIANELKQGKHVVPETFESVTIFFSDIVGFTALCSSSAPMEVVDFLNDLYTCFDKILENFDVYKVETIGDAYMVVSGLPTRNYNKHAGEIALMALNLLSSVTTFRIRHRADTQLQLRIGIHSGPVAAGVVGMKMPRYCLFGDTVNYASRMESSGLALRIHVSPECKAILDQLGGFHFESRGEVTMKGKGSIQTYFLLGRDGFNLTLPDLKDAATLDEHCFK